MSVNQVAPVQLTSEILAVVAARNAHNDRVTKLANFIIALGTTALQAAPYSFSAGDATAIFNFAQDQLHDVAVYNGTWFVASGATLNSGVPTANGASAFGYPFATSAGVVGGLGY